MTFFTFPVFAFGVLDSFPFSVSLVGFLFRSYMAYIVLILNSLSGISFTSLFLYAITVGLIIFRRVLFF